jgi:hypothetical protein
LFAKGILDEQCLSSCDKRDLGPSTVPAAAAGVGAVVNSCRRLTTLQLQQCVGPFRPAEVLQLQQQQQQQGCAAVQGTAGSDVQHRWQLSTLQLSGPAAAWSDQQMMQLLGLQRPTDSSSSSRQGLQLQQGRLQGQVPALGLAARLSNLCLVRVEGLTDGLLLQLAAAECRLQHLRLEHCYTPAAGTTAAGHSACSSSSSNSSSGGGFRVASFSGGALLQFVSDSCALSLRSLALRHAGERLVFTGLGL